MKSQSNENQTALVEGNRIKWKKNPNPKTQSPINKPKQNCNFEKSLLPRRPKFSIVVNKITSAFTAIRQGWQRWSSRSRRRGHFPRGHRSFRAISFMQIVSRRCIMAPPRCIMAPPLRMQTILSRALLLRPHSRFLVIFFFFWLDVICKCFYVRVLDSFEWIWMLSWFQWI